ncbi:ABC transporter permease [Actinospica sp. MGRD01-02]|uniref:ABC transporter permease n=1 Tax=Actinospica acidithermotolerans TaxID=2828514 RepID=A0A941IHW5_9ACTN|nr:ABC transporter permease [Actinospica acidithermotolerans]MBR7825583.1 ABC transporter permease [Actinospica acidithermotolerans]
MEVSTSSDVDVEQPETAGAAVDGAAWAAMVGPKRGRFSGPYAITLMRIATVLVILVFWQLASGPILPAYAVSNPVSVAEAAKNLLTSSAGWSDIQTTGIELVVGFALGVLIGTVLALVLGAVPVAGRVLEPLIAAVNGIPKIALAPLFLLFFGIGTESKIAIAVFSASFIMFYNLYLGLRLVDGELVEIVRVMGGRWQDVLRYVTLPSLAPPFFAGLKASAPLAMLGVIAGEFIASFNGLGHLLYIDSQQLDAAGTFGALVVLVIMSLIINSILTWLDNLVLRLLGLGDRGRAAAAKSR